MDAGIGRVVAALEAKGRLDDTIILFTSDHGLALGSHGLLRDRQPLRRGSPSGAR
jgi:choline-sulfatase